MLVRLLVSLAVLGSGFGVAWMSRGAPVRDDTDQRSWFLDIDVTRTSIKPGGQVASQRQQRFLASRQGDDPTDASHVVVGDIQSIVIDWPRKPLFTALPTQPYPNGRNLRSVSKGRLVTELQSELRRHQCYEGRITVTWDRSTSQALVMFLDKLNARLPVKRPEGIHLVLLRNTKRVACDAHAPDGREPRQAAVDISRHDGIQPPMALGGPADPRIAGSISSAHPDSSHSMPPGRMKRRAAGGRASTASARIEELLRHPLGHR